MIRYEIERGWGKYTIHKTGDGCGLYGLYLFKVSKNNYHWVKDYSIAKYTSLKTAQKHLAILEGRTTK
jgi:hypothetical protein